MIKKINIIAVIIYVTLLIATCTTYKKDNINLVKLSILNITIEYEDFDTKCLGTVAYADGYILTTAHSFIDTYSQSYISSYCNINCKKYVLNIISIDRHNDLALLKCDYNFSSTVAYIDQNTNCGDKLYLATDNVLMHNMIKATVVSNNQYIEYASYSRNLISINTNACFGDSGSPLIDSKGNIVGILCAKLKTDDNIFFVIKSQTIRLFLEDI